MPSARAGYYLVETRSLAARQFIACGNEMIPQNSPGLSPGCLHPPIPPAGVEDTENHEAMG
jgi:hypothetical protein